VSLFVTIAPPPLLTLTSIQSRVPEFLKSIDDPMEKYHAAGAVGKACAVCGGLGHSVVNCPKLEDVQRRQMAGQTGRDGGGGGY
jgi:ATP-dependent RNA helicase DDX41